MKLVNGETITFKIIKGLLEEGLVYYLTKNILNIEEYIKYLKEFIHTNNIKKVIDLGCGDWQSPSFNLLRYRY
jgi:hypothetical protein